MRITCLAHRVRLAIAAVAVAIAASTAVSAQQAATYEVVSSFDIAFLNGSAPSSLRQANDGTCPSALQTGGSVFEMDAAAGSLTTLRTFFGSVGVPLSNLFEGNDGSLYGTAFNALDSPFPPGPIFRLSTAGSFSLVSQEYTLQAGVIQARDGRLYGTSAASSAPLTLDYHGRVFRVETNGTITVLHQFEGGSSADPVAELVQIDDGSLYGTTAGRYRVGSTRKPPSVTSTTERSSALTRPQGRSRQACASTVPMARRQPAG